MSTPPRRRRDRWLTILAIAAVVIVGITLAEALRGFPSFQPRPSATVAEVPRPDDAVALTVRHVYDGDTLRAQAEQATEVVDTTDPIRIRLIGVDTPEGTPEPECWADEARAHLRELLPEGTTVWVVPDEEAQDRYGRHLFYAWNAEGRFVNLELLSAGDAETITVAPNTRHQALFARAEETARAAEAGRWGVCGQGAG